METHTRILDISSARAIEKVVREAKQKEIQISVVGVRTLTMRDMKKQGLVELIGKENFKDTIEEAFLER
jgi:MFS superfamily sulfate permease-like transporter